ncbi:hypothetical protein V6N13_013780 [Hibiscus sabdariffa]
MSKILLFQTVHSTPRIHPRTVVSILSKPLSIPSVPKCYSPISPFHSVSFPTLKPHFHTSRSSLSSPFSTRAFDDSPSSAETQNGKQEQIVEKPEIEEYPSGELEYEKISGWKSFVVKFKMLIAFPWERVRKGSVLTMKLRGQISDQLKSRFSSGLSLPQICENFLKAAYDPRISGVYLHIEPLNCGWGKVEEIRRHILNFKKSGKFIIAYTPACGEKEFYLACACEEIYAPPSAYFSLYGLTVQASFLGGVFEKIGIEPQFPLRKVISMLKERLGVQKDKILRMVDYKKYSKVRKWTLGLTGGRDLIAVIRASGSISRVRSPLSTSSGIIAEQIIEKIRSVRESKKYKAAIIRIDSPGGDALASDLMWREIRLLAASKPVIASMSDVAASGGYYMAMAAQTIVAENLTLTGSIGVVTGKFNLGKLYEKIGFNKEVISRGRYAELLAAEQRPLRPDEAELFAKSAQNAYKQFRDKAAFSRSMPVEKMEEVAQGRVWAGKDAASLGLVDAIGGLSQAIAIAKHKINVPQDKPVTLVELSRPSSTLPEVLSGIGSSIVGVDRTLKELLQDLTFSDGVQARMDGIMFQRLEGLSNATPLFSLIKDYLSSL